MNVIGPRNLPPRPTVPPAGRATPTPEPDAPAPAATARPASEATLWDLLTTEEREFFAQQSALGPLSYRPDGGTRGGSPLPTGRRIDVRG